MRGGQRLASHSLFLEPHSTFPDHHSFHSDLVKLPMAKPRRHSYFLLRASWRRRSWTLFRKMTNFKYCTIVTWRGWGFTCYLQKSSKGFFSRTTRLTNWRTSWHNSPGEALQVGESSIPLRHPVAEISEVTNTRTDRQTHTHKIWLLI